MKAKELLARFYPFSRIFLTKDRTIPLSLCIEFDPDPQAVVYKNGHGERCPPAQERHGTMSADSECASHAGLRNGFASQCGYVYDRKGTLVHGLTHKYRPEGGYKPLSRVCEKVTGRRRKLFGFSYFPGDVAVATASTQRYYYHWMVDVLPRIEMIRRAGFKGPVYADSTLPYQRETIDYISPNIPIVDAQSHILITADRLIVPVHQVFAGNDFPGWIVDLLKEGVLGPNPRPEPDRYPERIYVIRNRADRRSLTNEMKLCDKLVAYGFDCLAMEDMSVQEQAKHFFNADIVVAPHGGGLTNLVFSQRGTKCVELFGRYDKVVYKRICQSLGIEYRKLNGSVQQDENGRFHEDFSIDPDVVTHFLESMGVNAVPPTVA